ncbi:MAG: T9SS type A sorting domain-containing protein [Rhodothermales bacterium]
MAASSSSYLSTGNVSAQVFNNGELFTNGDSLGYEVPRGSGKHALEHMGIWIASATDGDVREAGTVFGGQSEYNEFWPGPLSGETAPTNCNTFDRIYRVQYEDDVLAGHATVRPDVSAWPVNVGAEYDDVNGVPGYQPFDGDTPRMYGDEMLWWLMNDRGNRHQSTRSDPVGVEVTGMAYVFENPGVLGNTTFYRYEVRNKNLVSIDSVFIGWKVESRDQQDWYIGTDTTRGMMYLYSHNSANEDYGNQPPAVGVTVLAHSYKEDSRSSVIERAFSSTMPLYREINLLVFSNYMFQWLTGEWPFVRYLAPVPQPLVEGGAGGYLRTDSGKETKFMYPGDPIESEFWSMMNTDGEGSTAGIERQRMLGSIGPFSLAPDEVYTASIAVVWSQGMDNWDSIRKLRQDVDFVRGLSTVLTTPRPPAKRNPPSLSNDLSWAVYPNPSDGIFEVRVIVPKPMEVSMELFDVLGRKVHSLHSGVVPIGETTFSSIPHLPTGTYYLRGKFDHVVSTRSVVVN